MRRDFAYHGGNHLKCETCEYSYFVNQAPTAGLVIFDEAGRVMLAKRKFEPYKRTWQSVGGFVGLDEPLEAAAIREAEEELAKLDITYPDLRRLLMDYMR